MNNPVMAMVFLLFSIFCPFLFRQKLSKILQILLVAFSLAIFLPIETFSLPINLFGMDLQLIKIDKLSRLLVIVFHLVAIVTIIYGWEVSKRLEDSAAAFYFASAVALTLAGDLLSFFVFWEMLTVGAVVLIFCSKLQSARLAANRYLIFHVLGGLVLLAGVCARYYYTKDLSVMPLSLAEWYNLLIFLAIGVNVAFPLFHTWVVDAYPKASPSGTIWLSAITTKTAAYAMIRMFPGEQVLIWIGVVMMTFPVFYAVIENNLRKVLSYSLINQVGLIITAVGLGSQLALAGASSHIVTDIFFKGLLFMSVGAVLYRTSCQNATDLGGLYKSMPITCFFCVIGALSISAFPLFSGFISKSLVVSAAAEQHQFVVWIFLLFASSAVLEHAGIKVPFFTFFAHDSGKRPQEAPLSMLIAMAMSAIVCILLGCWPELLYGQLPFNFDYQPYTAEHIVTQLELLLFAALAFVLMLLAGLYPAEKRGVNLDADSFYKKVFASLYLTFSQLTNKINERAEQIVHNSFVQSCAGCVKLFPGNIFSILTKKSRHWHESVIDGTLPVAISIFFALLIFVIMLW